MSATDGSDAAGDAYTQAPDQAHETTNMDACANIAFMLFEAPEYFADHGTHPNKALHAVVRACPCKWTDCLTLRDVEDSASFVCAIIVIPMAPWVGHAFQTMRTPSTVFVHGIELGCAPVLATQALGIHHLINLLILLSTVALCMETMPEYSPERPGNGIWAVRWHTVEVFCVSCFTVDFVMRLVGSLYARLFKVFYSGKAANRPSIYKKMSLYRICVFAD